MKRFLYVWVLLSIVLQFEGQALAGRKDSDKNTLVLLCKGTQHCSSCSETSVDFNWTYTVDLSAKTVDGFRASISNERITWQLKGKGVLDQREINRYSKKFHFAGKSLTGGGEIYYGDGTCELQAEKAF